MAKHIYTCGPIGLRVQLDPPLWKVEISDPANVVTTVWVRFASPAREFTPEEVVQHALNEIKYGAKSSTGVARFYLHEIPAKYTKYLWNLIAPYEIHTSRGVVYSGSKGGGSGRFKLRRLNPSTPPRRNPASEKYNVEIRYPGGSWMTLKTYGTLQAAIDHAQRIVDGVSPKDKIQVRVQSHEGHVSRQR